jgi:hypothetical protein
MHDLTGTETAQWMAFFVSISGIKHHRIMAAVAAGLLLHDIKVYDNCL